MSLALRDIAIEKAIYAVNGDRQPAFKPESCGAALGREIYRQMPNYAMQSRELLDFIRAVGTANCPLNCPACSLKRNASGELPAIIPH